MKNIINKLEKEKKVSYVSAINYNQKQYVKTIKSVKNGIEYIYYEIRNGEIIEVDDEKIIEYFRKNYELKVSNILY